MAATPAESTPLLQEQYITDSRAEEDGIQDFSESWTKPRVNSVILVYVMIALLVLATALSAAASARLYENGLCREYCLQHDASWVNPDGSVPERLCKVPGVQAGLSKIMTRVAIGEQVLGCILVLPYGALAERRGSRLVLILSLSGFVLSTLYTLVVGYFWNVFPIAAVAFSPLFKLVGGGYPLSGAVGLALVAAIVPRPHRLVAYFFMGALEHSMAMISAPISVALLSKDMVYSTMLFSSILLAVGMLLLYMVPIDTPRLQQKPVWDEPVQPSETESSSAISLSKRSIGFCRGLIPTVGILNTRIAQPLFAMIAFKIGRQLVEMLGLISHYPLIRLGWSAEQAGRLTFVRGLVDALVLLLIVLPLLYFVLSRILHRDYTKVDFFFALFSALALAVGSFIMGLSHTAPFFILGCVIFALGSGGQMSLYSFANGLVDNIYVTAIYTYGALADGVGMLAGTAVVSSVLREGLATGEIRPGLPFCLVAGAYLICFILILLASRK